MILSLFLTVTKKLWQTVVCNYIRHKLELPASAQCSSVRTRLCWALYYKVFLHSYSSLAVYDNSQYYHAVFQFAVGWLNVNRRHVDQVKLLVHVIKQSLDVSQLCVKVDRSLELDELGRHVGEVSLYPTTQHASHRTWTNSLMNQSLGVTTASLSIVIIKQRR